MSTDELTNYIAINDHSEALDFSLDDLATCICKGNGIIKVVNIVEP